MQEREHASERVDAGGRVEAGACGGSARHRRSGYVASARSRAFRLLVRCRVPRGSSCDSRPRCRTRSACSSCRAQRRAACNPGDTEKSNRSSSPESIRRSNSIASSRRRRSSRSAWAPRTARSAVCVGRRLCVSTREHRVTVPLRVRLRPLNRILLICGRGRPYHVHLPESRGSHAAVSERGSGWRRQCRRLQYASVKRAVRGLRACRVLLRAASFAGAFVFIITPQIDW